MSIQRALLDISSKDATGRATIWGDGSVTFSGRTGNHPVTPNTAYYTLEDKLLGIPGPHYVHIHAGNFRFAEIAGVKVLPEEIKIVKEKN